MIMVILLIADIDLAVFEVLEQVFIYASLALTVISLVDYLVKNKNVLADGGK